jgi:hypothetical protein
MDMFAVLFRDLKQTTVTSRGPQPGDGEAKLMLVSALDEDHAFERAIGYLRAFNDTYFKEGAPTAAFDRRHRHCWLLSDPAEIEEIVARIAIVHPTVRADHDAAGFRFLLFPLESVGFDAEERRMLGLRAVEYALKR